MVRLLPDIRKLETIGFLMVDVKHSDGGEGSPEGGEAEDEHRGGVRGISLVGTTYEHGDDGASEILDKENHRVSCAETFQRNNLRNTRPEGGRG